MQKLTKLKRLLYSNSKLVKFCCASILINICLIVLLPQIHESFEEHDDETVLHNKLKYQSTITINGQLTTGNDSIDTIVGSEQSKESATNTIKQSPIIKKVHSHDNLATGELLICFGFFLFYIIGSLLSYSNEAGEVCQPLIDRNISTCSKAKCCTTIARTSIDEPIHDSLKQQLAQSTVSATNSQNPDNNQQFADITIHHQTIQKNDKLDENTSSDDSCVLLLNKHHQHPHHHHNNQSTNASQQAATSGLYKQTCLSTTTTTTISKKKKHSYGSLKSSSSSLNKQRKNTKTCNNNDCEDEEDLIEVVSSCEVQSCSNELDMLIRQRHLPWPRSIKITLTGLILSLLLLYAPNFQNVTRIINSIRGILTGALFYIAFYVVLPSPEETNCDSCAEYDADLTPTYNDDTQNASKLTASQSYESH